MTYPEDFDAIVVTSRADLLRHDAQTQVALCIHRFEAEVNNGGLHQYFANSSGELVPQTLRALNVIGAVRTQERLERAVIVAFPRGYPSAAEAVAGQLADSDQVMEGLEKLDVELLADPEPLADLVNTYLSRPQS